MSAHSGFAGSGSIRLPGLCSGLGPEAIEDQLERTLVGQPRPVRLAVVMSYPVLQVRQLDAARKPAGGTIRAADHLNMCEIALLPPAGGRAVQQPQRAQFVVGDTDLK
jgi:hypothetical protein